MIARNQHGAYSIPNESQHRPVARTILAGQVWEADTLAYLCDAWQTGDLITAGAYFGDFLPALAATRPNGSRLWAFEPNLVNHEHAERTIAMNKLAGLTLTNAALGARQGVGRITTTKGGRSLGGASHMSNRGTSVPIVALDDVIDRPVSVIHLDVEGYEAQALAGATRLLDEHRPLLVLETVPEVPGYQPIGHVDRNTILAPV